MARKTKRNNSSVRIRLPCMQSPTFIALRTVALTLHWGQLNYQTFQISLLSKLNHLQMNKMQTPTISITTALIQTAEQMRTMMVSASLCLETQMKAGRQVRPIQKQPNRTLKQVHRPLTGARSVPTRSSRKSPQRALESVELSATPQSCTFLSKVNSHSAMSSTPSYAPTGQASLRYSSFDM